MAQDNDSDYDYLLKLALIGDANVGKTNLVIRFVDNTFSSILPSTIGYDCKSKIIRLNYSKKKARLQIWDTAGQEKYMSLSKNVFNMVDGVILVYDITSRTSFEDIVKWIDLIKEKSETLPMLLVGNKIDRNDERVVEVEEGQRLADEYDFKYMETSALNGENVEQTFLMMASLIVEHLTIQTITSDVNSFQLGNPATCKPKKSCCN